MPESRKRKKDVTVRPAALRKEPVRLDSPRWLPIVMVAMWVIGLVWIVAWYMVPIPFFEALGGWNIAIGFAFISVGFVLATRWK